MGTLDADLKGDIARGVAAALPRCNRVTWALQRFRLLAFMTYALDLEPRYHEVGHHPTKHRVLV